MATGNEQKVSITASTNLSSEDIDKAVKDAQAHAEEDKKRKDEVETRNTAEILVYNCQKTLDELGDKISGEEKSKADAEIENVKKALEGSDVQAIKDATEKLQTVFYSISEKLYAQANSNAQTETSNGPTEDANGNVYDADYKVENDNESEENK